MNAICGSAIAWVRKLGSAAALALGLAACGTSSNSTPASGHEPDGKDAGSAHDAGPSCVTAPKTHLEIINACTDAEVVDKKPDLPLLLADGGLPPLP